MNKKPLKLIIMSSSLLVVSLIGGSFFMKNNVEKQINNKYNEFPEDVKEIVKYDNVKCNFNFINPSCTFENVSVQQSVNLSKNIKDENNIKFIYEEVEIGNIKESISAIKEIGQHNFSVKIIQKKKDLPDFKDLKNSEEERFKLTEYNKYFNSDKEFSLSVYINKKDKEVIDELKITNFLAKDDFWKIKSNIELKNLNIKNINLDNLILKKTEVNLQFDQILFDYKLNLFYNSLIEKVGIEKSNDFFGFKKDNVKKELIDLKDVLYSVYYKIGEELNITDKIETLLNDKTKNNLFISLDNYSKLDNIEKMKFEFIKSNFKFTDDIISKYNINIDIKE